MAKKSSFQTHFTYQVQVLLDKIYGRSKLKDSMLERAIGYFDNQEFTANNTQERASQSTLESLEKTARTSHLLSICQEVIALTEGDDFEETNRKSAQVLGTIQLISSTEGTKVAANNELRKSLYKAILSIRLLDRLLLDNDVNEQHLARIVNEYPNIAYADFDLTARQRFTEQIKIPLLMAALMQDIGNYHPQAQAILVGTDKKQNPYRTLEVEQRKKLLQLNYKYTLNYINEGLGVTSYIGNSRDERDQFVIDEQAKIKFIQDLLKSSVKPKQELGNLLKVPQIYCSIIFSTKESYNYKLLPKVFQVVNKNAEIGTCSQKVVDALYQITGMFPQGYGVIYMPEDASGQQSDCYEYAIVNRLYPPIPEQPLCRITTRKLTFISYGHNIEVKTKNNLYFPHMAKKVANLSKDRLNEILELLSSNYQERQELDLLPRCWHTHEFFSVKVNQKLWNKEDQ